MGASSGAETGGTGVTPTSTYKVTIMVRGGSMGSLNYSSIENVYSGTYITKNSDGSLSFLTSQGLVKLIATPNEPTIDKTYSYEWGQSLVDAHTEESGTPITGNIVIAVTFSSSTRQYTLNFYDWSQNLIKTISADYGANVADYLPSNSEMRRDADDSYAYEFTGWDNSTTGQVESDMNFYPVYRSIDYTITIRIYDNNDNFYSSYVVEHVKPNTNITKNNDNTLSFLTNQTTERVTIAPIPANTEQYTYSADWGEITDYIEGQGDEYFNGSLELEMNLNIVVKKYQVVFYNYDNSVAAVKMLEYGTTLAASEEEVRTLLIAKPDDNYFTYTFNGWSLPGTTIVNGTLSVTPQYTSTRLTCTLTIEKINGSYFSVNYSELVVLKGTRLTLSSDKKSFTAQTPNGEVRVVATENESSSQYRYIVEFENVEEYSINGQPIESNITITARAKKVVRVYTITFNNWDGTKITEQTARYGDSVQDLAPGSGEFEWRRSEGSDEGYLWEFNGWSPTINSSTSVTGDATYTAQYQARDYTIKINVVNYDGTITEKTATRVQYNSQITINNDSGSLSFETNEGVKTISSIAPADETRYYYTINWGDVNNYAVGSSNTINSDLTLQVSILRIERTFKVTFKNYDGSVIEETENTPYAMPAEDMEPSIIPTKPSDNNYNYVFSGWNPSLESVGSITSDTTFIAQFNAVDFTITLKLDNSSNATLTKTTIEHVKPNSHLTISEDGYTLTFQTNQAVQEQSVTLTPKEATAAKQYTAHWSNADRYEEGRYPISSNIIINAKSTATTRKYAIVFKNYDGTTIQNTQVEYGATPTYDFLTPQRDETTQYRYIFNGWNPAIVPVTQAAEYTALYIEQEKLVEDNEFTIKINNVDYSNYAQIGMVYRETKTEELDSMTIILNNIDETEFEAFQDVEIKLKSGEQLYFYVNSSVPQLFNYEEQKYTYTISLISRTKILERVILPNLKIRKPIVGTIKTINTYLQLVVMKYVNKQFPFLTLSNRLTTLCSQYECPEIEWGKTNAKNVINDLLSTIPNNPCIVKITNNVLDYVSLAEKNKSAYSYDVTEVDTGKHYQMSEYANNIVMDVNGIIPNKTNAIDTLSVRPSSGVELTDTGCQLIIPGARFETIEQLIVHVPIYIQVEGSVGSAGPTRINADLDITEYLVEQSVYNTLKVGAEETTDNKLLNIYFTQGGNTIDGFMYSYRLLGLSYDSTYHAIILNKYNSMGNKNGNNENLVCTNVESILNATFTIKYRNVGDSRIKIVKTATEEKDCSIYQGQNQGTIDMKSLMKTQRESVNRLGNEILKKSFICKLNSIPKLGDYIGDYIMAEREVAYFYDFAILNATFSKNYIQKNVYYGISTRKKYTQLAQANESTIREEFTRLRVCVSTTNIGNGDGQMAQLAYWFASFFNGGTDKNIKVIEFKSDAMATNVYASMYPKLYVGDKSVVITTQCEDNYSVGSKIVSSGTHKVTDYVSYVDSKGEMTRYNVYFYSGLKDGYDSIENCQAFPEVRIGKDYVYLDQKNYYKDNSETLKITYQFDFVAGDDNVVIGNAIGENNIMAIGSNFANCKLVYQLNHRITKQYPTITSGTELTPSVSVTNNKVTINNIQIRDGIGSWALVDVNGEIIIGVNRDPETNTIAKEFYINVKGE